MIKKKTNSSLNFQNKKDLLLKTFKVVQKIKKLKGRLFAV